MHEREPEVRLEGGNTAESVVRLGSTVRKPASIATPAVQGFVAHLRSAGFRAAPEPLGVDDHGRQVWEYRPGPLWASHKTHTRSDLFRVGTLIATLHRAAASFRIPHEAQWNHRYQFSEQELICHNDLAPWNLVCGDTEWTFIDWDAAGPATSLWDLAWACISFPAFEAGCDLLHSAEAMRSLLDGYGLTASKYSELIEHMVTRARAEYRLIVEGARNGEQPWLRLHAEQHHDYWGPVADYIERNASALVSMLNSGSEAQL